MFFFKGAVEGILFLRQIVGQSFGCLCFNVSFPWFVVGGGNVPTVFVFSLLCLHRQKSVFFCLLRQTPSWVYCSCVWYKISVLVMILPPTVTLTLGMRLFWVLVVLTFSSLCRLPSGSLFPPLVGWLVSEMGALVV